MTLIPFVAEQEGKTERAYDIYSRLLRDNIIFIGTEINDDVVNLVIVKHSPAKSRDSGGYRSRFHYDLSAGEEPRSYRPDHYVKDPG